MLDIVCRGCRDAGDDRRLARYLMDPAHRMHVQPWGGDGSPDSPPHQQYGVPRSTSKYTWRDIDADFDFDAEANDRKYHLTCPSCRRHVQIRKERIKAALAAIPVDTTGRVAL
ncbi:hypothetical protein [Candidatus Protofrankia californiensis]|uniref:hypothetical protein n=1 Tax=Candidatus Protofrankia californiensis TaxID=1839754 RepID=UPI0010416FE3|nr:hypothetical protein [Candidatus Protofrankia californiensis]